MDPRWAETLQQVSDPGLTVHRVPSATIADVQALCKTLAHARVADSTVAARATVPTATRPSAPPVEGVVGQDTFTFQDVLGKGGMGMVFNARQEGMSRVVAVKTLLDDGLKDPSSIAAFLREALTTGYLAHPNIVPVHFFGRDEQGRPFMVMKRVQGRPWCDILAQDSSDRSKEFDLRKHLEIFSKVCDAISFAHAHHIIHRDLKPANVMVGDFGEVTLMDWGLALDISPDPNRALALRPESGALIAGTPAYMAPEMVRCDMKKLGPATDVYLLGAILYEILSGKAPHRGKDVLDVMNHALMGLSSERIAPRPNLARESRELERMIRKAMAQEPEQRYPNVKALAEDIDNFLAGQGDREESEALAQAARNELTALQKETEDMLNTSPFYPRCTEILAKTQQSLTLWGFNPRAVRVRQEALATFADLALRGKDWGLAESALRDLRLTGSGGHALAGPLDGRLRAAREKARNREYLFQRGARVAMGLAGVLALVCGWLYWQLWETKVDLASARSELVHPEDGANPSGNTQKSVGVKRVEPAQPLTLTLPPPQEIITDTVPVQPPPLPIDVPEEKPPEKTPATPKQAQPPLSWRLPGDAPVKEIAVGAEGHLLLRDNGGELYLWFPGTTADAVRKVTPPASKVVGCAWAGGRTAVAAGKDGVLYSVEMPANERGLMQPWVAGRKADAALSLLTAAKAGERRLLAFAKGSDLYVTNEKDELQSHNTNASVLCLQYVRGGDLVAVTARGVQIWPAKGHGIAFPVKENFALAACASEAPALAMVLQQRRNEISLLRPNLATGQGAGAVIRLAAAPITALACDPAGSAYAVGTEKGEVLAIRGQDTSLLTRLPSAIEIVAFGANGKTLYAVADGAIHIVEAEK
ncbi:MAG TPA: protein kinase [Planctomycetota bacterium]|nr:protein kinase [Planctomycetota bacterium]